jgi:hypothetical protein
MSIVTKDALLSRRVAGRTKEVEIAGLGTVQLRYPLFAEWYGWIVEQNKLGGAPVPPSMIASTIAMCLANEDGTAMLTRGEADELLDLEPALVVSLYEACKKTIASASDDEAVEDAEGK